MNQTNELKIEAGKFYRDRKDRNWEAVKSCKNYTGIPLFLLMCEKECCSNWVDLAGRNYTKTGDSSCDLISEWIDAPEVDWSFIPPWFIALAMNKNFDWRAFTEKPSLLVGNSIWSIPGTFYQPGQTVIDIPSQYAPKFTGDWKDSLVCRPGFEKKD